MSRVEFFSGIKERNVTPAPWGEDPIGTAQWRVFFSILNTLLILVVLLLLFGGGGFYFGGPVIGGSGLGLVLLICLVIYFMGGFRTRHS